MSKSVQYHINLESANNSQVLGHTWWDHCENSQKVSHCLIELISIDMVITSAGKSRINSSSEDSETLFGKLRRRICWLMKFRIVWDELRNSSKIGSKIQYIH